MFFVHHFSILHRYGSDFHDQSSRAEYTKNEKSNIHHSENQQMKQVAELMRASAENTIRILSSGDKQ